MLQPAAHLLCCCVCCLQAGTPAGVSQSEAAAEGFIEALQQQEDLALELQQAQEAAEQPEQLQLQQQHEELQQQLQQLSAHIKRRQRGIEGRGPKHAADSPTAGADVVVVEDGDEAGGAHGQAAGPAAEEREQNGRQQRSKRRKV